MNQIEEKTGQFVGIWEYIPRNAFLFFPIDQQIKIGAGEKQWRKIFQNNQPYEKFQQQALESLDDKLSISNITVHPWFSKANKLRYLQANKWKKTPTCEAITQYSRYRYSEFPFRQTPQIVSLLSKGTFYICGRDNEYRPIIVADLNKFEEKDVDFIPSTLVLLMEFMINNLLIQGQVQNYILVMNLESFQISKKNLVSKIIAFTSNSYRGRLFVSYLLGAPTLLRFGWNSLASNFVSENTRFKIKITGDMTNQLMWNHIDKSAIQTKYGGTADNIKDNYWPPNIKKLNQQPKIIPKCLISVDEYNQKYENMKLQKRKVLKSLLRRKTITMRDLNNLNKQVINEGQEKLQKKSFSHIDIQDMNSATILVQSSIFPTALKCVHTFFKSSSYLKIK